MVREKAVRSAQDELERQCLWGFMFRGFKVRSQVLSVECLGGLGIRRWE